ncbi:MAG: hypothetical protein KGY74_10300 [Candidatus Cloacimonetes bacterium]|nr:hypothetical protein [Candidatus Cloacimonadota bacterium]
MTLKIVSRKQMKLYDALALWSEIAREHKIAKKEKVEKAWTLWIAMQELGEDLWKIYGNEFNEICINHQPDHNNENELPF